MASGLSNSYAETFGEIRDRLQKLEQDHAYLQQRDVARDRVIRRLFWGLIGVALAAVIGLALLGLMYAERGDARDYYNEQIHKLVCTIPPHSKFAKQLRAQYECPKYVPLAPMPTKTVTRSAHPGPTNKQGASSLRRALRQLPPATHAAPSPRPVPKPSRPRIAAAAPTSSATPTPHPTPHATPTPRAPQHPSPHPRSTQRPHPIHKLLCKLLGHC